MFAQSTIASNAIYSNKSQLVKFSKVFFCCILLSTLTACSGDDVKQLNMTNPAADYCIEKGGTRETVEHINGDVSLCTLADGEVIEEWELFRRDHQKS